MSFIQAFGSIIFDENGNVNFQSENASKHWTESRMSTPHTENIEISDCNGPAGSALHD